MCPVSRLGVEACLSCPPAVMFKAGSEQRKMLSLTNHDTGGCARWCALVVLLSVCSLTVSVATRYSSSADPSSAAGKSVQKHSPEEPGRQRLTKNAATWVPPVAVSAMLHAPSSDARISFEGPRIPK